MRMMKAAVVHTFGQALRIEEVPVPEVLLGQVLVKVVPIARAFAICQGQKEINSDNWTTRKEMP